MSGYGSTAVMGNYDFHHPAFPVPSVPATPESGRRTRSGRTILSTHSPARITKSSSRPTTRNRSPSRNRSASRAPSRSRSRANPPLKLKPSTIASRAPQITLPLSILTADSPLPVRDIHAWVNRSAAQRQTEAAQRNGYITRPMNSFMLYRSAYAERTKHWGAQNNHQVVSAVAGQSWPLEPKEIRELYEEYARIERDNHAAAHPGYKFSPSKVGPVARARMRAEERDGSDLDDEDDADSDGLSEDEYRPARRGRDRGRAGGRNRTSSPSRNGRGQSHFGAGNNRPTTPTGNNRNSSRAPMTPPGQVAHPYRTYDGSPQVAPFQLPQTWMVTTHDNAYTSSPQQGQSQYLGNNAGSYDDYSSYNFNDNNNNDIDGYLQAQQQQHEHEQQQAIMQARAQYRVMQLAQQMHEPMQHPQQQHQDGSSYMLTAGNSQGQAQPYYDNHNTGITSLSSLPNPAYFSQQQQSQHDPFLSISQQQQQHHDPFVSTSQQTLQTNLYLSEPTQSQAQSLLYPPIDTIPRQYHGNGSSGDDGLNLSYHSHHSTQQDHMLDPALLNFGASGHDQPQQFSGLDGEAQFGTSARGPEQPQHVFGASEGEQAHHSQNTWGDSFGEGGHGHTEVGHGGEGDSLFGGAFD